MNSLVLSAGYSEVSWVQKFFLLGNSCPGRSRTLVAHFFNNYWVWLKVTFVLKLLGKSENMHKVFFTTHSVVS